jgi:hypothetical protein
MTGDPARSASPHDVAIVRAGGLSLIVGAAAFMAVFSYLAARFNYPDVLDGRASDVLPALLATGNAGRLVWAIYALLPLIWIPAAVGAFHALRETSEGMMRTALLLATVSSLAMMIGLMRWPSFHWELALAWTAGEPGARPALDALFNAANSYLGNYIGEFLGELTMNAFFLLAAVAMLRRRGGFAPWLGWVGVFTATAGLVGMFRNATSAVAPLAELNNYLLPVWMILFGIGLLRFTRSAAPVLVPLPRPA